MAPHLHALFPEELEALAGCSADEARRAIAHAVSPTGERDAARRPLSRTLQERIASLTRRDRLEVVERATDPGDGFMKYLFRSPDGALTEAVRIPLHVAGRYSVCLSSQVGCAMECDFCATGRLGFTRNLEAWEMVEAFRLVREELPDGARLSGAVFMGQGEPFANYDEVIRAARLLSHPCGGRIAAEAITISTVGLVPQIRRFTREGHAFKLIVSLTSALPEKRARLLPVAGSRWSLEDLAEAIREYSNVAKIRVTIAWVLLGGLNDGPEEVEALSRLLQGVPLRLNLIDVNDPTGKYTRASDAERLLFMDRLQVLRSPVVRRYSGGAARHAACGMLAATRVSLSA